MFVEPEGVLQGVCVSVPVCVCVCLCSIERVNLGLMHTRSLSLSHTRTHTRTHTGSLRKPPRSRQQSDDGSCSRCVCVCSCSDIHESCLLYWHTWVMSLILTQMSHVSYDDMWVFVARVAVRVCLQLESLLSTLSPSDLHRHRPFFMWNPDCLYFCSSSRGSSLSPSKLHRPFVIDSIEHAHFKEKLAPQVYM